MIRKPKFYLLGLLFLVMLNACNLAKRIPEGQFLLNDNAIAFEVKEDSVIKREKKYPEIDNAELAALIRPEKNHGIRLYMYNHFDTVKWRMQVEKKAAEYYQIDERKRAGYLSSQGCSS